MYRYAFLVAMLIAMLPCAPSFRGDAKDKMATCKFGADDQKLQGAARNTFMKKCMSNKDDPRGPANGRRAAAETIGRKPRIAERRTHDAGRSRGSNPPGLKKSQRQTGRKR